MSKYMTTSKTAQMSTMQQAEKVLQSGSVSTAVLTHKEIAKRAYEKYEARGRAHGFDREDWTAASRELVAETFGHLSLCPRQHVS